jgi:hypothetical protein
LTATLKIKLYLRSGLIFARFLQVSGMSNGFGQGMGCAFGGLTGIVLAGIAVLWFIWIVLDNWLLG